PTKASPKDPTKASPKAPRKAAPRKTPVSLKRDPKTNTDLPKSVPPKKQPKALPLKALISKNAPAEKVHKTTFFKGNKATQDLMKRLAHLQALRSLGRLGKDKLDEFGLSESPSTLSIRNGSNTRVFRIGHKTYGNQDYYLQDQADQRVYVVRGRTLSDMRYAEFRLMDRELIAFSSQDIESIVLTAKDQKKTLFQHNRRKPSDAFWTDDAEAQRGKDIYRNWFAKLSRLRVLSYTRPKEAPKHLEKLISLRYIGHKKPLGTLTLFTEQTLAPGTVSAAPGGAVNYYARSKHTRVFVKITKTLAADVAKDIATVLGK
ncbi:MAG: DUF4340 domain-containing protein, partial [Deltaproteobacteria bacterium]|nr:DUF4340 domain-containing protein [Deltaproteobacteria bacterium]